MIFPLHFIYNNFIQIFLMDFLKFSQLRDVIIFLEFEEIIIPILHGQTIFHKNHFPSSYFISLNRPKKAIENYSILKFSRSLSASMYYRFIMWMNFFNLIFL